MTDLLRKPTGQMGKVHDITPATAGWGYVGFGLYRLKAGERAAEQTGETEVILVLVEGKAELSGGGKNFGELGDRMSVFEETRRVPTGRQRPRPTVCLQSARRPPCPAVRHSGSGLRGFRSSSAARAPIRGISTRLPWKTGMSPTASW